MGDRFDEENGLREWSEDLDSSAEGDDDALDHGEADGDSSLEDEKKDDNCQLELPLLPEIRNTNDLESETSEDETLKDIRRLATEKASGYSWEEGRIIHRQSDDTFGVLTRIVVPFSKRSQVLQNAHKALRHLRAKRLQAEVSTLFTWPGMTKDVKAFVSTCERCLRLRVVLGECP